MQSTTFFRFGARGILSPIPKQRALTVGLALLTLFCSFNSLHAQARQSTASRRADLQIGGSYSGASPDYGAQRFYGFGGYATLDFTNHIGVELNIRQTNTTADNKLYERVYEVGGRYVLHYGRVNPYGRISVGRGVFNFPNDIANLAYNLASIGGGVDVNVIRSINVRGDFEAQKWFSFQNDSLMPMVATVGVAYHFH
jgi:hypothetical protein